MVTSFGRKPPPPFAGDESEGYLPFSRLEVYPHSLVRYVTVKMSEAPESVEVTFKPIRYKVEGIVDETEGSKNKEFNMGMDATIKKN